MKKSQQQKVIKSTLFKIGSIYIITLSGLFYSCKHEPQLVDDLAEVCYTTDIEPMLQASCGTTGCHDQEGNETNFSTRSYSSVMNIVSPGDARASKLYQIITAKKSDDMMPPEHVLTLAQRNTIMVWIEQGAVYKDCKIDSVPIVVIPPKDTTTFDSVCFTETIQPLLVSNCATTNCHSAGAAEEGITLTDYNSIINSDEALIPYQPENSKIYKKLLEDDEERMPPFPNPALTDEEKESIRKWIAQGAKNTNCTTTSCDTNSVMSYTDDISPIIKKNCLGCHNATTTNGGVNLSDYDHISTVASSTINDISLIIGVTQHKPGFPEMPPTGSLNNCDKRKIELWVEQGIQNN